MSRNVKIGLIIFASVALLWFAYTMFKKPAGTTPAQQKKKPNAADPSPADVPTNPASPKSGDVGPVPGKQQGAPDGAGSGAPKGEVLGAPKPGVGGKSNNGGGAVSDLSNGLAPDSEPTPNYNQPKTQVITPEIGGGGYVIDIDTKSPIVKDLSNGLDADVIYMQR